MADCDIDTIAGSRARTVCLIISDIFKNMTASDYGRRSVLLEDIILANCKDID